MLPVTVMSTYERKRQILFEVVGTPYTCICYCINWDNLQCQSQQLDTFEKLVWPATPDQGLRVLEHLHWLLVYIWTVSWSRQLGEKSVTDLDWLTLVGVRARPESDPSEHRPVESLHHILLLQSRRERYTTAAEDSQVSIVSA